MNITKGQKLFLVKIQDGMMSTKTVTVRSSHVDRESWNCDSLVDFEEGDFFICGVGAKTDNTHTYVNIPIQGCYVFLSDDKDECFKAIDTYLHQRMVKLKTEITRIENEITELEKVKADVRTLLDMKGR